MIAYIDTSVFINVLLSQQGYKYFHTIMKRCKKLLSSPLIEAEVLTTCQRENFDQKQAIEALKEITLCFVEKSLIEKYEMILKECNLKGADAYHLATALYLDPSREFLHFLTDDLKQKEAAKKKGFKILS